MTTDLLPLTDPRAQRKVAAARAAAIRQDSEAAAELARVRIAGEERLIEANLDAATVANHELMLAASHQERLRAQELREALPADQVDQVDEGRLALSPARLKWWHRGLLAFTLVVMALLFSIIVVTQLDFYRQLDGLQPKLGGIPIRIYLAIPVATEMLSLLYGAFATYCLYAGRGNHSKYVRWMWIYASIAAVVNASHALTHLAAGDAGLTAFVLGGGSLASPGAWHAFIGTTLGKQRGRRGGVKGLARGARMVKHPFLTRRFLWACEVFPDLTHDEVWAMVAGAKRARLERKYRPAVKTKASKTAKVETAKWWPRRAEAKAEASKPVVVEASKAKAEASKPARVEASKPVEAEGQAAKVEASKPTEAGPETEGEQTRPMPRIVEDLPENWAAIVAEGVRCADEHMGGVVTGAGKRDELAALVRRSPELAFPNKARTRLQQDVKQQLLERQAAA